MPRHGGPAPPRDLAPRDLVVRRIDAGHSSVVIFSFPLEPPGPLETLHVDGLTEAERDVVRRAMEGRSNAEIARARGTAVRTVANLLARSFRKLGVASRRELAAKLAPDLEPDLE